MFQSEGKRENEIVSDQQNTTHKTTKMEIKTYPAYQKGQQTPNTYDISPINDFNTTYDLV